MNPPEIYSLSPEQRQKYKVQPDMVPNGDRILEGTHEHVQVAKNSSMRFWYNVQSASFSSHWHTALEIIMPLEGNYVAHILSETYVLDPGDIFIIPAGTIHSLEAPAQGSRLIYIFELNLLSQLPGYNYIQSLLSQPMRITYDEDPEYYTEEAKLILLLAEHYWGQSVTKEMNLYACLLSFFAKLGEKNVGSIPVSTGSTIKNSSVVSQLSMVLDYIDEHYSENMTLEQAAQIAGFSKFYFTRLFKEYTNHTFYEYLTEKRIHAAEQMLLVPKFPVTDVSIQAGFSSLSSFNRTFKRNKGCSPTEYRNLYTQGGQQNVYLRPNR
ncbi:MAG: helix-turn-helix domain-containing protein [Lachnospiraceae bacterium]|jgi:AraC-like DNA-binding protein/quercetin dioxygenase-like cupin family protein|nr:helix-turn-helix domain-containing protein [Lachnospiraceae bacterium]MBR4607978.1 helix-turn-helix domain-containing protein [Lachnospiraceae bacterium]